MKRAHQLAHVLFPALFALVALFMSLRWKPFSGELLIQHLFWGFPFYAAPHFLWAGLSVALKPSLVVWHSGFLASSCSLLLVGALSIWGHVTPPASRTNGSYIGLFQGFCSQSFLSVGFWRGGHMQAPNPSVKFAPLEPR